MKVKIPVWVIVCMAIVLSLSAVGAAMLKLSNGFTNPIPTILVLICYSLGFYLFSKAVRVLGLALGYAIWSGVGTAQNAVISHVFFDEPLGLQEIVILSVIILGIVLINNARIPEDTWNKS